MRRIYSNDWQIRFWLVTAATLAGAALRLYRLATLPISSGFDPAYYGLDALAILDGHWPIYLATNYGREPVFSYLVAILYAAIGPSDYGIHLASAFCGILTIPMVYAAAGELLRFSGSLVVRRWAPVLAAWLLALSYWHLVWSRFGVRAILAPFFVSLTMFLLLRALRRGKAVYLAGAGAAAAASLYTYQIGQLVPFLVGAVLIIFAWSRRRELRPAAVLRSLAWLAVPFMLLALPLAAYAARNPDIFNQRVRDVAVVEAAQPAAGQLGVLAERLLILLRFFSVEGDTHGMWSVGRLPGLNPLLLAAFVLGLLLVLWSWRKPLAQSTLAWLLIMLAPAILAGSGAVSKRALGALPAIVMVAALGAVWLPAALQARWPRRRFWPALAALLLGGVLLFTLFHTTDQYFVVWANDKDKDGRFDPQLSEMGDYIAGLPPDTQIYVSADATNHPNMLLHSRLRTASEDVRGYNGWRCFVYPERTESPVTYVLSEENSIAALQEVYPGGELQTEGLPNRYGYGDYFDAYHIPAGQAAAGGPQTTAGALWGAQIELLGYDLSQASVAPGESLTLVLYWHALQAMDTRYTAFVHLLGPENPATGNPIWAQKDSEPCLGFYPTAVWRPGEIIREAITLDLPAETPPGSYDLSLGFYTWPDFQRLPVGEGDAYRLQSVEVAPSASE